MALVWLAGFIGRHGLGNGFSVLIATLELPGVVRELVLSVPERSLSADPVLAPLVFGGAAVAALIASTARRPTQGWSEQPPAPDLLTPASGILAVNLLESLYHFHDRLPDAGAIGRLKTAFEPGTVLDALVYVPMVGGFGLLCVVLFNRSVKVATVWGRAPGFGGDSLSAVAAAGVALRRGAWRAVAFLGAMAVITWYVDRAQVGLDITWLTVIGCIAVDLVAEVRFRRLHADVVAVWPLHQTYAVGPALHALAAAGIPAFPRALRHGALLNFWGPYVPVEILVPRAQAQNASALLGMFLRPAVV
jgi:hypothetical protein